MRLQEEILKHSDDHSIFAWGNKGGGSTGPLARILLISQAVQILSQQVAPTN